MGYAFEADVADGNGRFHDGDFSVVDSVGQ